MAAFPTQFWAGRLIDASRRNGENLHFPLTWTKRWQFLWSICVTASYFSSEYLYIKHARTAYVVFAFGKRKISSVTSPMGKREVPNRQIASVIDYCPDNQPSIIFLGIRVVFFPAQARFALPLCMRSKLRNAKGTCILMQIRWSSLIYGSFFPEYREFLRPKIFRPFSHL